MYRYVKFSVFAIYPNLFLGGEVGVSGVHTKFTDLRLMKVCLSRYLIFTLVVREARSFRFEDRSQSWRVSLTNLEHISESDQDIF